jgi:hypothetical protein
MRRYVKICIFVTLLCVTGPRSAFGQDSRSVRLVKITSTKIRYTVPRESPKRVGSGSPPADTTPNRTELSIVKDGDVYKLDGQVVDPHLIAALVGALTAPANAAPNLDDLGVTPSWLKEHAASVAQRVSESTVTATGRIPQAALESVFADPAVMDALVPQLFGQRPPTCADCTHHVGGVVVTVTFDDGSTLAAATSSQHPFMLPWSVSNTTAYNAGISRAVAALMPDKSTNRLLLLSENLDVLLGRAAVQQAINLDVERRTGCLFDALRAKYTIVRASIGQHSDPVLRVPLPERTPENSSLFLQLQRSDTPDIFFYDEVILPYVDGNVTGTDVFLERAPQYEQLVLSVPWLIPFVQQNKRISRPSLAFSQGASLSDADEKEFADDMHAIGRDKLIAKVDAAKGQIALLIFGFGMEESDWLVFPDHHMVLWRYFQTPVYGKPDLLKWKPADFPGRPCAKTTAKFVNCVGTEVSPDGAFIAPE